MKKVIFLHSIRQTLAFAVCFMSGLLSAFGQAYVKQMPALEGDKAIVREYNENKYLIYSQQGHTNSFTMYVEGNQILQTMNFSDDYPGDKITVHDFEIFNDTVYFCGDATSYKYSQAIMGYFDLATFPASTLYISYASMSSFKKLDVFSEIQTPYITHVVFVGENDTVLSYAVDAIRQTTTNWNSYCLGVTDDILDDVAATDNHIVFTSRFRGPQYLKDHSSLYIYHRPSWGNTFFMSPDGIIEMGGLLGNHPVLIEHGQADGYAIVGDYVLRQSLWVAGFNGLTCLAVVELPYEEEYAIPLDAKYHPSNMTLDVLSQNDGRGIVYQLNPSNLVGGTVYVREPVSENLRSLDRLALQADSLAAVGRGAEDPKLHLYKYHAMHRYECAYWWDMDALIKEVDPDEKSPIEMYEPMNLKGFEHETWVTETEVEEYCN